MASLVYFRPAFIAAASILLARTAAAAPKVVAYVPNWGDLTALTGRIDYPKVTHLNVAFENPVDDTGALSFNAKNDALIATAHEKGVKVFVSIGGGSASGDPVLKPRYFRLIAPERRIAFARSLADYVVAHRFDGLDVDLEGPSINADYGGFIDALAAEFAPRKKSLTAALSEGYGGKNVPDAALQRFEFINIMAYDAAGYWNPNAPGPHSSLDFAKRCVAYWLHRGVPRDKAVLGVPFYGYAFGEAFRKRDYPYRDIVSTFPGAEMADETGKTVYYNGIPTIKAKAAFARTEKLGGVMIWSLDSDAPGEKSLLSALHGALTSRQ